MYTVNHQDLFKNMPVPRLIISVEEDGSYVVSDVNTIATEYFSAQREKLLGANIHDFMDQENAKHFEQSFEVCVEKKRPVTIQTLPNILCKVNIYGFYITPILSEEGEIEYLDVIGQPDVTDQSILQRERDDAISLLASVFEVSEVGIVVTDQNSRIVRVNDSFVRIYGWEKDELISTELSGLVTPDEREHMQTKLERAITSCERDYGEMKIIKKDGNAANVLYASATLELSQKRRFQVITIMDITLRKKMEQSLRMAKDQADSANRAKSTFLANMSHELRTPLNAIIGFSEMIFGETFGPLGHDKYKEYLGDIVSSARHLLEIINEVLDMSKIEAGRLELDETEMDIRSLIKAVTRMMDSKIFASDLSISLDMAKDMPNIRADERLMRQVLINLVNNAVKFSKPGDTITVRCYVENKSMHLIVADEGFGIPKEKIQYVMEPFGQVADHAEHQHDRGTGLGLPLAKAMIELHGGDLTLESDIGQGTTIHIIMPAERVLS